MKKITVLLLSIMTSVLSAYSQNSYEITSLVKPSDIKDKNLQWLFSRISKNQRLRLPIIYEISFFHYQENDSISFDEFDRRKSEMRWGSYKSSHSPFYANLDKRDKRPPTETLLTFIEDTNGKYIMGIIQTTSAPHDMFKNWLVTFDFAGSIIDYIPIMECPGCYSSTMEAQINKDFTVNVQRLDFPNDNYIVQFDSIKRDFIFFDNLKGQRIDSKYQLMPDGKFKKLEEIYYQPQIYTPSRLKNEYALIRHGREKVIEKKTFK